jgi:hypothetical protein
MLMGSGNVNHGPRLNALAPKASAEFLKTDSAAGH